MNQAFFALLKSMGDSLRDLLPIILVISFFQLFVLQQPIPDFIDILLGTFSWYWASPFLSTA